MSMRIDRTSAIVLAVVLVAGCTPLPMADAGLDAQAKTFAPSPDRANVYVYRNERLGAAIRMSITVDGQERGITRGETYLFLQLEPGQHTIYSQGNVKTPLTLVVAAGKNYFIWQEVKYWFGTFHYRSRLQLVDETTGREGVNECEQVLAAP